jgi:hypothetical protein
MIIFLTFIASLNRAHLQGLSFVDDLLTKSWTYVIISTCKTLLFYILVGCSSMVKTRGICEDLKLLCEVL